MQAHRYILHSILRNKITCFCIDLFFKSIKPNKICIVHKFSIFILIQKTLTITNLGKRLAAFRIIAYKRTSLNVFQYDYTPRSPLAAGMNSKLVVTFNCTSLEDVYELITIITKENKKKNVLVCAENAVPILKCKYIHFFPLI